MNPEVLAIGWASWRGKVQHAFVKIGSSTHPDYDPEMVRRTTQPRIDGVGQAEVISAIKRELEKIEMSPEEFKEFVDRAKDAYHELTGKGAA